MIAMNDEKKMSWKRIHDQFNSYWNDECSETIKKSKNYVKYSLIHKMKKIQKLIFMRMIANKKSYTKQKF